MRGIMNQSDIEVCFVCGEVLSRKDQILYPTTFVLFLAFKGNERIGKFNDQAKREGSFAFEKPVSSLMHQV